MEESCGCICEKEVQPIKDKFQQAEELIHKLNQMKYQTITDLEKRKADRDYFNTWLKDRYYWDRVRSLVDQKKTRLHYLQQALDELKELTTQGKNRMIQELCQQMQHRNNNLAKERRILRAIKHAKEDSEKPSSDADEKRRQTYHCSCHGYIPDSKEGLNDQINLILSELQELKKKQKPITAYEKELEEAEKVVCLLEKQLHGINKKKRELYAYILDLRKQRERET
ncbi:Proton pump-interactor like [Abeliophyllum distichum]|uniref:Proton pump-interactor like n=1 Tax=Abeliophyllum distichum TaxID=126358 RepID=A0ABD1PLZ6_9LAMI